jgi:hypothetical protein
MNQHARSETMATLENEKINRSNPIYSAVGRTRNAQAFETEGEERMTTEIQGNPSKDIINQPQNMTEITKDNDGLLPTRQLFTEPASSQNGKLVEFIIHCQKQALAEPTIQTKYKILRVMIRNNVNLADPEQV